MMDLARFFATLTAFVVVLISRVSHEEIDIQQLMMKIPLKQAQDCVAVFYFCKEIISKYPDFLKDFIYPLWEGMFEFTKKQNSLLSEFFN